MVKTNLLCKQFLLLWLLSIPTSLVIAQLPAADTPGSADHDFLQRFAESRIIANSLSRNVNYRFVTGNLRRIAGNVVAASEERLHGDLTRITYEASRAFTGEDVYEFFLRQMQDGAYKQLYTCSGRACGNSNYWANDVFGDRILYGPERNQFYIAARGVGSTGRETSLALYINTRTNGSLYIRADIIELDAGSRAVGSEVATQTLESLLQQASIRLAGARFTPGDQLATDADLSIALELLENNPELRIMIVAHLRGAGNVDELSRRSQLRADAVRAFLIENGIAAARLSAHGVGPLAPVCNEGNCDERVELVQP